MYEHPRHLPAPRGQWETGPGRQFQEGKVNLDKIAIGDSANVFRHVAEMYFSEPHTSGGDFERIKTLHEKTYAGYNHGKYEPEPALTVCIPTSIDDVSKAEQALAEIAKQDSTDTYEIYLFANLMGPPVVKTLAELNTIQPLMSRIHELHPNLKVKATTINYEGTPWSMGRVRKDYMDIVAYDGMQRGFSFDHPVVWLDADTYKITPANALQNISRAMKAPDNPSGFMRSTIQYAFEGDHETVGEHDSDMRRLAAAYEIGRRKTDRHYAKSKRLHGYNEESGFIVSLGAYVMAGGVSAQHPLDETAILIENFEKTKDAFATVLRHAKPTVPDQEESRAAVSKQLLDVRIRTDGVNILQSMGYLVGLGLDEIKSLHGPLVDAQNPYRLPGSQGNITFTPENQKIKDREARDALIELLFHRHAMQIGLKALQLALYGTDTDPLEGFDRILERLKLKDE